MSTAGRVNLRVGVVSTAERSFRAISQSAERTSNNIKRSFSRLSAGIENNADSISAVGAGFTAIGAVGVAAGIKAVQTAKEYKDSAKMSMNALHQTEAEANALNKRITKAYQSGMGESLAAVTDTYIKAKQMFKGMSADELDSQVETTLNITEIFPEVDQTMLMRATENLKKSFGASTTEVNDFIVRGLQEGLNFGGDFADVLAEYANNMGDATTGLDDLFNTLKKGKENGALNMDQLADAMRESLIKINDGSAAEAITIVGEDFKKVQADIQKGGPASAKTLDRILGKIGALKDPKLRKTAGVGLIGGQFEDNPQILAALANTKTAVEGVDGATKKLNENMAKSQSREMASKMREMEATLVPLGNALLDLGSKVLPPLADGITWLINTFNSFGPVGQGVSITLGLISAAIGPILLALPGIMSLVPVFKTVWSVVSKGMVVFNLLRTGITVALGALAGPVGIAIAVIGGLIAVGYLVWKHWDKISKFLVGIWDWVTTKTKEKWNGLVGFFKSMPEFFAKIGKSISGFFRNAFENLGEFMKNPFKSLLKYVSGLFRNIGDMGFKVPKWIPGVGGKKFSLGAYIPKFHSGGQVSGTRNQERLAILQGGERVLSASENARYGSGSGEIVVVNNTYLDGKKIAQTVQKQIARNLRTANGGR